MSHKHSILALPIRRGGTLGVVSRRCLLRLSATILAPGTLLEYAQTPSALTAFRRYGLMDALEEHGQWASSPAWAQDVHKSMGAQVTALAVGTASGIDREQVATRLALEGLDLTTDPPDGAVVVARAGPGQQSLREAHLAYRLVRERLPLSAYCAYSPLAGDRPFDALTVHVALGWY